ncbi:hypothetical protein CRG98_037068 [Punica granatum]|uniref:Uncharacterized protein n=1 Tax=Punica granatum TaxID=22663 RepID=A0A2I0IFR7_PUNGR|nr:hypothetical protein CRG98_037068 [Punica granatum]
MAMVKLPTRLCLCIFFFVLLGAAELQQAAASRYVDYGVLNPCKRPGGLHKGCHPNPKAPMVQANPYTRGCTKSTHCRRYTD